MQESRVRFSEPDAGGSLCRRVASPERIARTGPYGLHEVLPAWRAVGPGVGSPIREGVA